MHCAQKIVILNVLYHAKIMQFDGILFQYQNMIDNLTRYIMIDHA